MRRLSLILTYHCHIWWFYIVGTLTSFRSHRIIFFACLHTWCLSRPTSTRDYHVDFIYVLSSAYRGGTTGIPAHRVLYQVSHTCCVALHICQKFRFSRMIWSPPPGPRSCHFASLAAIFVESFDIFIFSCFYLYHAFDDYVGAFKRVASRRFYFTSRLFHTSLRGNFTAVSASASHDASMMSFRRFPNIYWCWFLFDRLFILEVLYITPRHRRRACGQFRAQRPHWQKCFQSPRPLAADQMTLMLILPPPPASLTPLAHVYLHTDSFSWLCIFDDSPIQPAFVRSLFFILFSRPSCHGQVLYSTAGHASARLTVFARMAYRYYASLIGFKIAVDIILYVTLFAGHEDISRFYLSRRFRMRRFKGRHAMSRHSLLMIDFFTMARDAAP